MRTAVRLLLALVLLAIPARAGQTSFPSEDDCPHPLRKLCVRLSTDPEFQRAIAPFIADPSYPNPEDEEGWRLAIQPFVTQILNGLSRSDPCERLAALELASRASCDERVIDTLLRLYRETDGTAVRAKILGGLSFQAKILGSNGALRRLMLSALRERELTAAALEFADVVAVHEDIPAIADAFLESNGTHSPNEWRLIRMLSKLGCPEPERLSTTVDPRGDLHVAHMLLSCFFPTRVEGIPVQLSPEMWGGGDLTDFLMNNLKSVLWFRPDALLLRVFLRAPVLREGSAEEKVLYWNRLRTIFSDRPALLPYLSLRLAMAAGPEGLNDQFQAEAALRTVIPFPPDRANFFQKRIDDLWCKLRNQRLARELCLGPLAARRGGALVGTITGSKDAMTLLRGRVPFAWVDYLDSSGVVTSVPARWKRLREAASYLRFRLVAGGPHRLLGATKARLIFLPRCPFDLRVGLAADVVQKP